MIKHNINYFILFVSCLLFFTCKNDKSDLDKAQEYYNAGNYNNAITVLDSILRKEPKNYAAYRIIGLCYYQKEDIIKACQAFSIVIAHDSADTLILFKRATVLMSINFTRPAIEDYKRILTVAPYNIYALNKTAYIYLKLNRPDSALIYVNRSLNTDSSNYLPYYYKGAAYSLLGNDVKTIQYYNAAIAKNNKSNAIYFERGMAYQRLDSTTQAIRNFDTAIDISPNDTDSYLERGVVLHHLNKMQEACSDWVNAEANGSVRAKYCIAKYCK
jgi:tetratricopeptide (TPR) repeat protein